MRENYWSEIVDATYEDIYRFCLKLLGSVEDGKEATQESFFRAYKSLEQEMPLTAVRPLLYTIARNCCLDKRRWWQRWKKRLQEFIDPREVPQDKIDWDPILKLPRRQREVFILRHWHGFSTEESAKILGISSVTVKSHLKRAIEKLKSDYFRE